MLAVLTALRHDQSGATMIEYGLIAALVAIAAMIGMGMVGTQLNGIFAQVGTTIAGR